MVVTKTLTLITNKNRIKSLNSYLKEVFDPFLLDTPMVSWNTDSVEGMSAKEALKKKDKIAKRINCIIDKFECYRDDLENLDKYLKEVGEDTIVMLMDYDEEVDEEEILNDG